MFNFEALNQNIEYYKQIYSSKIKIKWNKHIIDINNM